MFSWKSGAKFVVMLLFFAFGGSLLLEQASAIEPSQPEWIPSCEVSGGSVNNILYHDEVFFIGGQFSEPHSAIIACDFITGEIVEWFPSITHSNPSKKIDVQKFAVSPDGSTLYVGGKFDRVEGVERNNIVAFDISDLSAVTLLDWNPDVKGVKVFAIEPTSDGEDVYIGGNFYKVGNTSDHKHIGRVDAKSGVLDTNFQFTLDPVTACGGSNVNPYVMSMHLSPDDQTLYLGGLFDGVDGESRSGAAAIDTITGTLTSFAPNLKDTKDCKIQIFDIVQTAEHIYYCGDWWQTGTLKTPPTYFPPEPPGNDGQQRNVNRFDPVTGEVDLTWMPWTDGGVQACALDWAKQRLIVGGHFRQAGSCDVDQDNALECTPPVPHNAVMLVDLGSGALVEAWNPFPRTSDNPNVNVWAAANGGGKVVLGGEWFKVEDQDQKNIALFDNDGGGIVYVSSTSGGKVGGIWFSDEDIVAYNLNSGAWSRYFDGSDVGLSRNANQDVDAFHLMDDGSILLSLTGNTTIPDVGWVKHSDIVRFIPTELGKDTSGRFEMYFDGSDVGLTTKDEDIVGIGRLSNGDLMISTVGATNVPGLSATIRDEDVLKFSPQSLGGNTAGTWSLYFDGSDVGLNTSGDEDVWGVSFVTNNLVSLTTKKRFEVPGLSGDAPDIILCDVISLGSDTACAFSMFWDGSEYGFGHELIDGLHLVMP